MLPILTGPDAGVKRRRPGRRPDEGRCRPRGSGPLRDPARPRTLLLVPSTRASQQNLPLEDPPMRKLIPFLTLVLVASACGDDGVEPELYPEIAGDYDYEATVQEEPDAALTGTLEIFDVSRTNPEFVGSFMIYLVDTATDDTVASVTGPVSAGTVSEQGAIEFDFGSPSFHHTGTLSGSTISGTWVLQSDTLNVSGPFSATRR
jgi:hypothetical protein